MTPRAAVWRVMSKNPWRTARHGAAVVVAATAQGAVAATAGLLAQRVAGGSNHLFLLAAAGVVATSAKAVAQAVAAKEEARVALQVADELREAIFVRLGCEGGLRASGRAASSAATAARELEGAVKTGVLGAVRAGVGLIPLVGVLVWTAPVLALVGGTVLAGFGVALARARGRRAEREARVLAQSAALEHAADDLLRAVDVFRVFGTVELGRRLLAGVALRARGVRAHTAALRALLSGANEVAAALGLLLVVVLLASGAVQIEPGRLVVFVSVFFLAYRPLRDLADARGALAVARAALATLPPARLSSGDEESDTDPADARILRGHLEREANGRDERSAAPRSSLQALELEDFGAAHARGRLTAEIAPGELVALRGPNGAGKTSLLRALLGLDEPSGVARYGGADLGGAPFERPFAWVPSEGGLVHATLRQNLALGGDEARAIGFLDDIAEPGWSARHLDELVGDGGRTLSAGERTWVLLARAFGSGLPVLLIDEPTAHLDGDAERRFFAALDRVRGLRSVLFVSHRAPAAGSTDRTLDLDP